MIYSKVPFPVTLSDRQPRFQGHGVIIDIIDILGILCAQLTRDLFAIAKFLSHLFRTERSCGWAPRYAKYDHCHCDIAIRKGKTTHGSLIDMYYLLSDRSGKILLLSLLVLLLLLYMHL